MENQSVLKNIDIGIVDCRTAMYLCNSSSLSLGGCYLFKIVLNMVSEKKIERFVQAQNDVYSFALNEMESGRKRSHWMWFIFPQLKGLGHSYKSRFYGISGTEEASEYLKDPILGQRLREISNAILNLATDDAVEVFGGIDSRKLKSSMTLFDYVSPNDIFAQVLDKYFDGRRDNRTITILETIDE